MRFVLRTTLGTLALATPLFLALPAGGAAQAARDHADDVRTHHPAAASDSADVVAAVEAFHQALQSADTAAVRELLADDVLVAESGGLETREEYLSHHLPGDMAFAAAVAREPGPRHVTIRGDVAWVTSTSRTTGTYRDRAIDASGAELMVLARDDGRWRIQAIHWSSRQAR
jgi:ketosteroid isomerase-like protein